MVFAPKNRRMIVANDFPPLHIGSSDIQFVQTFKYLEHLITNSLTDDK